MSNKKQPNKMTLEEYQRQNNSVDNIKAAKSFLFLFTMAIAVVIIVSLFFVVLRLFEIHQIAGYTGSVVALFVFIFGFLVPVIKLKNTKYFMTNVDDATAPHAQRHNRKLREEMADRMIDLHNKAEDVEWYSEEKIGKLAIARHSNNNEQLKDVLTDIYTKDIKVASNKLIKSIATQVGVATAISQSETLDTVLVLIYELKLIKDIVYLYGYRPNDAQMAKIYKNVLRNALIAYGVGGVSQGIGKAIGTGLTELISSADNAFLSAAGSVIGSVTGTILGSGMQFVVNSRLTTKIGYQTKKYLIEEFKLQNMLDNVELLETEEEQAAMDEAIMKDIRKEVSRVKRNRKTPSEPKPAV